MSGNAHKILFLIFWITLEFLLLITISGCATKMQTPGGEVTCYSSSCVREVRDWTFREDMLRRQKIKQEENMEKELAEAKRLAKSEENLKKVREQVPCKIAVFNGYATGIYNNYEFSLDEKYMSEMQLIHTLRCDNKGLCSGFYSGSQLVEVSAPLSGNSDLITILAKVEMTHGPMTVILVTHPKYLRCR